MKGGQPGGSLRSVDWSRETLQPFEKNFYKASEASSNADPREVEAYRVGKEISVIKDHNRTCPNPITRFEHGNFPDYIMSEIRQAGYAEPTPTQAWRRSNCLGVGTNSRACVPDSGSGGAVRPRLQVEERLRLRWRSQGEAVAR